MGQESGLTNAQYALWLNTTASQDCQYVGEIFIKYTNNTEDTLTTGICDFMESTEENVIATFQEVRFSGTNGEGPWQAVDKRLSSNLERTVNFADVPLNIRRPPGG